MKERMPAGNPIAGHAWSELARERARQGDLPAAEMEWRSLVAWHADAPPADAAARASLEQSQRGYMMFLAARGRWAEAEALVRPGVEAALGEYAQGKRRALTMQGSSVQALFWIAIAKREAAHARAWLDAWEKAGPAPYARRNPVLGLARLAVADVSGDARAIEEGKAKLAALPATAHMCKVWTGALEGDALAPVRKDVVERHHVCAGSHRP